VLVSLVFDQLMFLPPIGIHILFPGLPGKKRERHWTNGDPNRREVRIRGVRWPEPKITSAFVRGAMQLQLWKCRSVSTSLPSIRFQLSDSVLIARKLPGGVCTKNSSSVHPSGSVGSVATAGEAEPSELIVGEAFNCAITVLAACHFSKPCYFVEVGSRGDQV
jgi:hypothetical protein